jgi:hypothetical protein
MTKDSVWERLNADFAAAYPSRFQSAVYESSFWRKRATVPYPLVAAGLAAMLAAVFALGLLLRSPSGASVPGANGVVTIITNAGPPSETAPVVLPAGVELGINADTQPVPIPLSEVLRYLGAEDSTYMEMKLPERRSFGAYGEPALLKAIDYSGKR